MNNDVFFVWVEEQTLAKLTSELNRLREKGYEPLQFFHRSHPFNSNEKAYQALLQKTPGAKKGRDEEA